MSRAFYILLFIFILPPIINAATLEYDAIIVRSDLPYDWTVAQAYSSRARIPIITTSPDVLDADTREQLKGFKETGHTSLLVFGGEAAISPDIEAEMVAEGFITHRIREVDRYGTSARVAVELYGQAETAILVNGESVNNLLNSQMAALQTGAPILYIKQNEIPPSVREALRILGSSEVILISPESSDGLYSELESLYTVRPFSGGVEFVGEGRDLRAMDIAIGLVLGALLTLILRRGKKKARLPYNILTEDEERIIHAIEENGGEMGQDALYGKTGFSRPKISRVVADLVGRDILEKTQFKRTFKLKIKKELFKD